jgi:Peptidase family C25
MLTNPGDSPKHQSVKLSVTVKSNLERKYDDAALEKIKAAVERWKDADAKRGIQTLHVAVDDPADENMKELGVTPVSGKATPEKIKQAIDYLWTKLTPDYLVLFGAHDIVPMFEVTNPTNLFRDDEYDKIVPTDNPYASSAQFSKDDPKSYIIPDRVIGRMPDMVSDHPHRNGDPAWFIEYLETARKWESKPESFYDQRYVICTDEAKKAGMKCIHKAFPSPGLPPLICPPESDLSVPRDRLLSPLHMIKCHGNKKDATFWGFPESAQNKDDRCAAITSATLRELPHLESSTVVAAMCCYGAQIFSPKDADIWPLASTYLRKGALGFVGSTMMAWMGLTDLSCADWIVTDYLRRVLEGASIGRALLESKQDNPGYHYTRGQVDGPQEEKTLIEYVLLGDPSIHPVTSVPDSANELAVQERRQRRVARALVAAGLRDLLPIRSPATDDDEDKAPEVFDSAIAKGAIKNLEGFSIEPNAVRVQRVDTRFPELPETRGPIQTRQSLEYYWSGKRVRGEQKQLCFLKVETDLQRRPWRASVMYTS